MQSQLSVSSSCPGYPPTVPPLPLDTVQPDIPPREDSFAAAYNKDYESRVTTNGGGERRSLVDVFEVCRVNLTSQISVTCQTTVRYSRNRL